MDIILQIWLIDKWIQITDLPGDELLNEQNHVIPTQSSVTLRINLPEMEKNDLDWLDQDKIIRYRFIVFDPLRKDYPPSLDMKTNVIPSEKRFAIQEINVKIKDGTFIAIPVSCEKCTLLAPAKEMIISY